MAGSFAIFFVLAQAGFAGSIPLKSAPRLAQALSGLSGPAASVGARIVQTKCFKLATPRALGALEKQGILTVEQLGEALRTRSDRLTAACSQGGFSFHEAALLRNGLMALEPVTAPLGAEITSEKLSQPLESYAGELEGKAVAQLEEMQNLLEGNGSAIAPGDERERRAFNLSVYMRRHEPFLSETTVQQYRERLPKINQWAQESKFAPAAADKPTAAETAEQLLAQLRSQSLPVPVSAASAAAATRPTLRYRQIIDGAVSSNIALYRVALEQAQSDPEEFEPFVGLLQMVMLKTREAQMHAETLHKSSIASASEASMIQQNLRIVAASLMSWSSASLSFSQPQKFTLPLMALRVAFANATRAYLELLRGTAAVSARVAELGISGVLTSFGQYQELLDWNGESFKELASQIEELDGTESDQDTPGKTLLRSHSVFLFPPSVPEA